MASVSAVPLSVEAWGLRMTHKNKPIFKKNGLEDFELKDHERDERKSSPPKIPSLQCRPHFTGINDGDSGIFLDWVQGILVAHLKTHHPLVAAWELWKPFPACLGWNIAPPQEFEDMWKDSDGHISLAKVQETLDEYAQLTFEEQVARDTPGPSSCPSQAESAWASKGLANLGLRSTEKAKSNRSGVSPVQAARIVLSLTPDSEETPPSPVRPLHMFSSGRAAGNKKKAKEIADREREDSFTFLQAYEHFYQRSKKSVAQVPAETLSDRTKQYLTSVTQSWLDKKIESHRAESFKIGWELGWKECAQSKPEISGARKNLILRAGAWLAEVLPPRPLPGSRAQADSHRKADEKFASLLLVAGESLMKTENSLKSSFDLMSGQQTITNLYQHFVPNADNYRRDLVASFKQLVPGQKPDGQGGITSLTIEFTHPLAFAKRIENMALDIQRVAAPVEEAEKAEILARGIPIIDAGRARINLPSIDLNGILARNPTLSVDYLQLRTKIREHCDAVDRQRIELKSLAAIPGMSSMGSQASGMLPVQAMLATTGVPEQRPQRSCYGCGQSGHIKRDCPRNRGTTTSAHTGTQRGVDPATASRNNNIVWKDNGWHTKRGVPVQFKPSGTISGNQEYARLPASYCSACKSTSLVREFALRIEIASLEQSNAYTCRSLCFSIIGMMAFPIPQPKSAIIVSDGFSVSDLLSCVNSSSM